MQTANSHFKRPFLKRLSFQVLLGFLLSPTFLTGCIAANNPFDAESPTTVQARAALFGEIRANISRGADEALPVIADARVTLFFNNGGQETRVSDDDGAFFFSDLTPGNIRIEVSHADFQTSVQDLSLLNPGETREGVRILLTPFTQESEGLTTVSGRVLKDRFQNHAGILVRSRENSALFGVTQPDGTVQLRLPPGEHELEIQEYGFFPQSFTVVVQSDAQRAEFETKTLEFVPGQVSGSVAVEDAAVAQAISLSLDRGGVDQVSAQSDGGYFLPVVPLGTYVMTAFADGHDNVIVAGIQVIPGEETVVADIHLPRSRGSISGLARYAPGFDDDNSGILVSVVGTSASAITNEQGDFFIEGVPTLAGAGYTLRFQAADFLAQDALGVQVDRNTTTSLSDEVVLAKQIGDFAITPSPYTSVPEVVLDLSPIPAGAVALRIGETPDLQAVSYSAFPADGSASVPYSIAGDDGPITLYVQYQLTDGSEVGPFSSTVVLDRLPPSLDVIRLGSGSGVTNEDSVVVEIDAVDATTAPFEFEVSEDQTFSSLVFRANANQSLLVDFAPPLTDGTRTFYVRVSDLAGNVSPEREVLIERDTLAPTLTAFSIDCQGAVDAAVCASSQVSLTISSPDATEWYVSLLENPPVSDEEWNSFTAPLVFTGLGNIPGTKTLYLYLRDAAGNVSASFSDVIDIDSDAPNAASVVLDDGADFISGASTSVSLTLFALGATQMRISDDPDTTDDAVQPYAPSAVVDLPMGLLDGPLTYYVTFVDDAGNEVTVSDSIVYDATAPIPGAQAVQIENGADFASSLSVILSLDATDASEMQVSTTDLATAQTTTIAWAPFAALSLALLPSGDCAPGVSCKEICVRFRDAAGNETDGTDCDVVNLDRTPPAVPVVVSDLSYTQTRTISLELTEQPADAAFSHYEILVTPGQNDYETLATTTTSPPTFVFDLPTIVDGNVAISYLKKQAYLIRLRAVDQAGNVGAEVPLQVVFDEDAPATPIPSETGNVVNAATYSLFFDASSKAHQDATFDHYEVGQISCDGPGAGSCASDALPPTWAETAQTDGLLFPLSQGDDALCISPCINKLFVQAVDAAGNASGVASVVIREDSVPPTKPKLVPKVAEVPGVVAPMRLEKQAFDSDVVVYEFRGGLQDNYSEISVDESDVVVFNLLRDEVNELCVRAKDSAGNVGTEDCAIITQTTSHAFAQANELQHMRMAGDFVSYVVDSQISILHDLQQNTQDDVRDLFWPPGTPPSSVSFMDLYQIGQNLNVAMVVESQTPGIFWVALRRHSTWLVVAAPVMCNGSPGGKCGTPWSSSNYKVNADTRLAVHDGYLVAALEFSVGNLPVIEVATFDDDGNVSASALRLRTMAVGAGLCEGTTVKISDALLGPPVVTWCETDAAGENPTVWRTRVDVGNVSIPVGVTELETGENFDSQKDFHQPVVNDSAIFYVDQGTLKKLNHSDAIGNETVVEVALQDRIQRLSDSDGERLVFTAFADATRMGSANVYLYHVAQAEIFQVTDGLLTPYEATVDGMRIMWGDRAALKANAYLRDQNERSWVSHGEHLTAFPFTDGRFTSWIDTRGTSLALWAFDHQTQKEFLLKENLSFGSAKEKGAMAANGLRCVVEEQVIDATTTLYSLATVDLQTLADCAVPPVLGPSQNKFIERVAIDEGGTQIAFSQDHQIFITENSGGCAWSVPVAVSTTTPPPSLGPPGETSDIALAVADDGASLALWEERIIAGEPELWCSRTPDLSVPAVGDTQIRLSLMSTTFSSPTVAVVDGNVWMAASFVDRFSAPDVFGVAYCELDCQTSFCVNDDLPTKIFADPGESYESATLSSDGFLVFVAEGADDSQLRVVDLFTGIPTTRTERYLPFDSSIDPSVAPGRVSFSSVHLGASDTWTLILER